MNSDRWVLSCVHEQGSRTFVVNAFETGHTHRLDFRRLDQNKHGHAYSIFQEDAKRYGTHSYKLGLDCVNYS